MKEGGLEKRQRDDQVMYTRHSNAGYKTYEKILASDEPLAHLDPEEQVTPDLSEKGIEFAKSEAEKLFNTLDPQADELFFVSSNGLAPMILEDANRSV